MKTSPLLSRRTQLLGAVGVVLLERAASHFLGYESVRRRKLGRAIHRSAITLAGDCRIRSARSLRLRHFPDGTGRDDPRSARRSWRARLQAGRDNLTLEAFSRATAYMASAAGADWADPDDPMLARIRDEERKRLMQLRDGQK